MEELLKNETVRMKIKSLSAPVKKAFIESLLDLYEQETEEMIDVIEESRMELMGHYSSFEDESKSLRAESRMLEDRRKTHDSDCVQKYVSGRKSGMSSRMSDSRLSYVDEDTNSKSIKEYLSKRGKKSAASGSVSASTEDIRSKGVAGERPGNNKRADSVLSTRSLPTPVTLRTVEEEKEEVMKNLTTANRQNEVERQRQAELIAKRREQRRAQKQSTEEKALELLEKALAMDKRLAERKQEQDQKIKGRLEDMKRKRAESRMDSRMDSRENTSPMISSREPSAPSTRENRENKEPSSRDKSTPSSRDNRENKEPSSREKTTPSSRDNAANPFIIELPEEKQSKTNDPGKIKSSEKKDRASKPKSDSGSSSGGRSSSRSGDKRDSKPEKKEKKEKKETEAVADYDFTIY